MKKNKPIKIHFTGPESSGKTTMAKLVAAEYNTVWLSEYSRKYLAQLNRTYTFKDLLPIAKGQLASEKKIIKNNQNQRFLFFDTSLLVIKVWSIFKYGFYDHKIDQLLRQNLPAIYFLCDWQIPWEYDPLRESQNNRLELFEIYTQELKTLDVPFYVLKGSNEVRLATIKKILGSSQT